MGRRPKQSQTYEATPSAARLTESLRDIGYDFPTAVADLVDNSIVASASRVDVEIHFDGLDSWVSIADDGIGMTANGVVEALRYGSRRDYGPGDLGRYGLGLKTAPLSQCRRVTVVTRRSVVNRNITCRTIDLDIVAEWDSWLIVEEPPTPAVNGAKARLENAPGTVVVWEKLDRVLPENRPEGGWARRRLHSLAEKTVQHLAMVFHRFLEGEVTGRSLTITVNGEKVRPWDPFARNEPATRELPVQVYELESPSGIGEVSLRRYILPSRDKFSSLGEFERHSGPLKWNRQQGLYIYRANRLVQWGGWSSIRAIDEHTKLARASLDFGTDLDAVFHTNVAKMRVATPSSLRSILEAPIGELCIRAGAAYRKASTQRGKGDAASAPSHRALTHAGLALMSAAMELGYDDALDEIVDLLRQRDPEIVESLGWR